MDKLTPVSSPSWHGFVALKSCGFAFGWFIIFFVHLTTFTYNTCFALFYWNIGDLYLMYALASHGIGMPLSDFDTISYVHIALAGVHGFYITLMILGSTKQRTLAFTLTPKRVLSEEMIVKETETSVLSMGEGQIFYRASAHNIRTRLKKVLGYITRKRPGLSANGEYFHTILILRELIEAALQTLQAVRMSRYLSHPHLNRFYVVLLVANCWSSVIIYSRWFWDNEAYRRFALVLCDCALDLMSTVGVAAWIVSSYVGQYDIQSKSFGSLLVDDVWFAKMMNEAQVVLVTSWSDMAIRVVFSLGLLGATGKMKELLRCTTSRPSRVATDAAPTSANQLDSVGPLFTNHRCIQNDRADKNLNEVKTTFCGFWNEYRRRGLLRMSRTLFAMWGVIVLTLHVDASLRTPLIDQLRLLSARNIWANGEVEREWKRFDRNTVEKLQILHCPAMEMPIYIQKFPNLGEILVYNTTLVEWNANAALSGFHHPKLQSLSVARSNMTDGFLPPGLQSQEFPSTVFDICFAETNLRALSDDLDVKWPVCSIFIENSLLTAVPPSLLRLQLLTLSLSGNPIQTVPRELFEKGYTHDTRLSRTLVRELPQNVSFVLNYATQLVIMNTSISFFWSWIDPLAELALEISSSTILAGGSTYCLDLEKILSGTASMFSEPFQPGHSTLLMNASEANWDILRQVVDCTTTTVADHSMSNLAYWDGLFALGAS